MDGAAKILGVCEACRIDWTFSFSKKEKANTRFENRFRVQYVHPLLPAPRGDRGGDFKLAVKAVLLEEGNEVDRMDYEIGQDEKNQLRQEYVDMGKKRIPKWEELTDEGGTAHFTLKEFNTSEKVDGGQYEYILCKILDRLELVRNRAGNIAMTINSGFRNPYKHHNILKARAMESLHIYGLAADIALDDFNRDGKKDKGDWLLMARTAKAEGACVEPFFKQPRDARYRAPSWVHMDWRGDCPDGW